jgi:putative heme-binding domain-containing protein
MRKLLLSLAIVFLAATTRAEPFEIKDGDRVLFLGDTLLEREGTYGYLETRMVEQFPDRKFTVRNLAFSADTPLGWSRASFDPAAKGFERLKEQLALVKPTVVFLGYGMAASLQEMTDRSQDWTLNRDPARYGAEPMSAARFKKELAHCMDAIVEVSGKDTKVRFVLLSPIQHQDLRKERPGLPDPTEHNNLIEQYSKAIEELAKEREARFVKLVRTWLDGPSLETDNGIHLVPFGYFLVANNIVAPALGWGGSIFTDGRNQLRAAIIRKNALFFHRWRPANETYLFGFRKREQGQNAGEIPKFDPLIEAAEAEIEKLKKAPKGADATPAQPARLAGNERSGESSENSPALQRWVDGQETDQVPAGTAERSFRPSGTLSSGNGAVPSAEALGYSQGNAAPSASHTKTAQKGAISGGNGPATDERGAASDERRAASDECRAATGDCRAATDDGRTVIPQEKADFQPKTPILTSAGQLYAANDTPATGSQPPVTSHQSPVTAAPDARQTPAETPDLSKVAASPSTLPLPTFTLADGLEISLWAENPLLAKPTQCNWDAQGRLWVASSAMYPQIAPGQEAFDKILVIEDPGHTGKGTKSTVFADGLLIPTGVAPVLTPEGHWACYVGQSTEILYFEDTDGDGKADKKRIVFSGFGTEDTHHIVHTLRWGPDGRLYFSQSVYIHTHMETPWGVVRVNSGGVFAYDPRTERVEVVEKGLWNTWGHAWDQWGQPFYTDGAGSTGLSWGFPGATFAPNEGARRTMASISPGSYPKFAGLELIYSPHFPAEWQGSAVTCDFRAHKIVHFKINDLGEPQKVNPQIPQISADGKKAGSGAPVPSGNPGAPAPSPDPSASNNLRPSAQSADTSSLKSGYVTEQLPVLVQTSDATFRPIDVKLGPDGALYIADWSNPIINHGEVDFRDPRRDHEHGRIWRLSMKGGKPLEWQKMTKQTAAELLEKVTSPSLWESDQAAQNFIQNLEDPATAGIARRKLDEALKRSEATLKLLKAVRLNRAMPVRTGDDSAIAALRTSNEPNLRAETVGYFNPDRSKEADKALEEIERKLKEDAKRAPEIEKAIKRIIELEQVSKKEPKRAAEIRKEQEALIGEAKKGMPECGTGFDEMVRLLESQSTNSLAREQNPRVRVMIMRMLARIPTLESASLILDAAIHAPKDDPQYEFAAWLSINDLAEVWTKAVLAGEWKPEGREKQFEFALNAIEPALAGQVLSQFVSTGRAPLDGSGPWFELIGQSGGPAELRPLLDGLLGAIRPYPAKYFKMPGAAARAAAALVAAARRGVKPAGEMPEAGFYFGMVADAKPDVLRLAGLWKQDFPAAIFTNIIGPASAPVLDAAFESLRTLGTPGAVDYLISFLDPSHQTATNNAVQRKLLSGVDADRRRRALAALAPLHPNEAMKYLDAVLKETGEPGHLQLWRDLFASPPFLQRFSQAVPKDLPPAAYASAMRAAREMGRKGEGLANKLAPLAGESTIQVAPADYNDLAARAKKDGDPVAGEAIYRRMASACVTCHAIGGAGGKLGPDMTSIGASAPPDYIIESILNPAAKVKEGYHAFTFAMKDGTEAIGIPSRETPQEQFIRTLAGEQGLPKANIVSKKIAEGGASLMPVGLTAAWSDRERLNLYAFLMELGRPGPFDASKNNVARVWQLTDTGKVDGALKTVAADVNPRADRSPGTDQPALSQARLQEGAPAIPAYTLVDGRLTKDLLAEKLALLAPKNAAVHLTTRFQTASAGKAKLNLTGIRKAWLDGQPLAIASEPSPTVELTAGAHTFTVEVDTKSPPEVLRLESPAANFLGD